MYGKGLVMDGRSFGGSVPRGRSSQKYQTSRSSHETSHGHAHLGGVEGDGVGAHEGQQGLAVGDGRRACHGLGNRGRVGRGVAGRGTGHGTLADRGDRLRDGAKVLRGI